MTKSPFRAILLLILLSGSFVVSAGFGVVHASTDVTGIISSDITWTKAGSPYSLTGHVLVSNGVTLTIEPGVTVYLNEYYIRVDGTLVARGSSTDKIHLEVSKTQVNYLGEEIEFTSSSTDWDEQTGSGCIIENAVINIKLSISNSPKISNNIIDERIGVSGEPLVVISNNTITDRILVSSKSSVVIANNTIISQKDYSTIISVTGGSAVISNNNIMAQGIGGEIGIHIEGDNQVYVSDNTISGFKLYAIRAAGATTIERNRIVNNNCGIQIGESVALGLMVVGTNSKIVIRNNTIEDNSKGISGPTYATTIVYNNIQSNSEYNIGLRGSGNTNATYNWWGTTSTQAINQTLFDFKRDFNLGTVTFTPFLTEPNPETEPRPAQATQTLPIPEFQLWTILPLLLTVALVVTIYRKKMYKTTSQQSY